MSLAGWCGRHRHRGAVRQEQAAAVGAAKAGAQTLLVESGPFLGGAATLKNVLTYCGLFTNSQKKQAVFGVADQVLQRLREMGAISEPIQFHGVAVLIEPESVKYVLDQLVVSTRACRFVCTPCFFPPRVTEITSRASRSNDHGGNHEVRAKAFVDASGEGDLAFFGGASVRYGNHGTVQTGTLSMRLGGITADADLSPTRWTAAIQQAKQRGVKPLVSESGLFFRVPITNDVATYFIDQKYDGRRCRKSD